MMAVLIYLGTCRIASKVYIAMCEIILWFCSSRRGAWRSGTKERNLWLAICDNLLRIGITQYNTNGLVVLKICSGIISEALFITMSSYCCYFVIRNTMQPFVICEQWFFCILWFVNFFNLILLDLSFFLCKYQLCTGCREYQISCWGASSGFKYKGPQFFFFLDTIRWRNITGHHSPPWLNIFCGSLRSVLVSPPGLVLVVPSTHSTESSFQICPRQISSLLLLTGGGPDNLLCWNVEWVEKNCVI